jgi:hypothetical protein
MKNPSIGPWKEYKYYIDSTTKEKVILPYNTPDNTIRNAEVISVTKYEDFLMKTSFLDLDFMIWKILCATAMDQEIISIDCHATHNGSPCNKSYDWVYSPVELLEIETISPVILEEMKKTSEVQTREEIEENYKSSMLVLNNTIELPTSKIKIIFGHISAYDYLDSIYGEMRSIRDIEDEGASPAEDLPKTPLTVLKYMLIPQEDETFIRIKGYKNLKKILTTLDEIDWQTIGKVIEIMMSPYSFKFSLRNLHCPQCHNKSEIPIRDMSSMLFLIAQSLQSVEVTLKKI